MQEASAGQVGNADTNHDRRARTVGSFLRPARSQGLTLTVAIGLSTGLPLAAPQLTRRVVDGALAGDPTDLLIALAAGYLVITVLARVAMVVTAWLAARLAWDATNELREHLTAHALALDLEDHSHHTPGEMIERVDGDVHDIGAFVVAFLLDVVSTVLLLIGVVALVFVADVRIGAALVVYLAVMGVAVRRAQRPVVGAMTAYRAASARSFGQLEERFAALDDIRANGAGRHVVARFRDVARERLEADIVSDRLSGRLLALTFTATGGMVALVLAMVVILHGSGAITLGTAILLLQYMQLLQRPLTTLVHRQQEYQKALAGLARANAFLRLRPTLPPPTAGGRPLPGPQPGAGGISVELDRVSFTYRSAIADETGASRERAPALHDVSLRLAPGNKLGLVGHTGSGKSTLARLLVRLHDPTVGAVRLAGVDLREAAPASLLGATTFVAQDVQLFAASVRDNLTLFRPGIGDDRLLAALGEVGMVNWLTNLPEGLATRLGPSGDDGGRSLSAGEAQLLSLARAFATDPRLVILDEPSSRLDPAAEQRIEEAVGRLLEGRTAVVIAHRLSSLARMDEIAVLDAGHLVEHGTHHALMSDPHSRFARLVATEGPAL